MVKNTVAADRSTCMYRGVDKSLARPGRKQANISVRMAWISFGALPCRKKKNLMTARVSILLKSRASLTCFRACFLPGRAKELSAPPYSVIHTGVQIVTSLLLPVPVAARSKAWVCGRSPAETVGSNPTGAWMFVLWVLCVVRLRSLRRAYHSSRGVLPNVVRRCVWYRNLVNEEAVAH